MRNATSLLLSPLLAGTLLLAAPQPAAAHDYGYYYGHRYDVPRVHDRYHRVRVRETYPHWLRAHRDFTHWYRLNRFRIAPHVSWHRVHDIYLADRQYHRKLKNKRHYKKYDGRNYKSKRHYKKRDGRKHRGRGKHHRGR
ncbi:MAG: hypothetical protein WD078_01570 [Woeseia sp.]